MGPQFGHGSVHITVRDAVSHMLALRRTRAPRAQPRKAIRHGLQSAMARLMGWPNGSPLLAFPAVAKLAHDIIAHVVPPGHRAVTELLQTNARRSNPNVGRVLGDVSKTRRRHVNVRAHHCCPTR